jgi:hypothetical protein
LCSSQRAFIVRTRALSGKTAILLRVLRRERRRKKYPLVFFFHVLVRPLWTAHPAVTANASGTRLAQPLHLCDAYLTTMRTYSIPAGSTWRAMVDHDLAHIEGVLLRASDDVLKNAALPPSYWRDRLRQIKDGGPLLRTHLEKINALLRVLDRG